jgi:hypothetical protein
MQSAPHGAQTGGMPTSKARLVGGLRPLPPRRLRAVPAALDPRAGGAGGEPDLPPGDLLPGWDPRRKPIGPATLVVSDVE